MPRNAFRNSVFGASKLASAKTPLLKPYYRLHGQNLADVSDLFFFSSALEPGKGRKSPRRKRGGEFYLEIERGGEGFRGGEAGWCTPGLGGCRGKTGGAKYFRGVPKCPLRKGWFCKTAVVANVPSFRLFCTVVVFYVPSFRFLGSVVLFFFVR